MDIKSLQMFQHLANSLHFGQTAENFHVSPSTLSRAIQRLESDVGCDLLHRDNRTVVLTEAGQKFKRFADQQIEQWQLLKLGLSQQQAKLTGKLHIYCSVTAAYSHLPTLLDRFRQQHPLVEIMITTGDAADALEQLQRNDVDLAIAAKPENLASSVYFHQLAKIPLAVIAPTIACQVQQQLQISPLVWKEIPIILPEHGPARKRFEQWYRRKQQGKPNIYATVSGHEALVSMVALGCGIGITPKVVVENSPVNDRVQYLENVGEIMPFDLGICSLKVNKNQAITKAFFDSIADVSFNS